MTVFGAIGGMVKGKTTFSVSRCSQARGKERHERGVKVRPMG